MKFPPDVFRKHVHQEANSRKGKSYWLNRQKKKNKKTANKAAATTSSSATRTAEAAAQVEAAEPSHKIDLYKL